MNPKFLSSVLFLSGALALSGCCGGTFSSAISDPLEGIYSPPPPNKSEAVSPVQDPRTEIWRPGYWAPATGDSFVWVEGKVIPRPDPTAVWAPARWDYHTFGWSFREGHWE
jgi:hypothetical protein